VREIARKDEDAEIEAHFDPETGVVTVYEGRRKFKVLERAARRAGLSKARLRDYLPYRMFEVEVAANTVYCWAAEEILARRPAEERPADPVEYAARVQREAQALRYRANEKPCARSSPTRSSTAASASTRGRAAAALRRRCSTIDRASA